GGAPSRYVARNPAAAWRPVHSRHVTLPDRKVGSSLRSIAGAKRRDCTIRRTDSEILIIFARAHGRASVAGDRLEDAWQDRGPQAAAFDDGNPGKSSLAPGPTSA